MRTDTYDDTYTFSPNKTLVGTHNSDTAPLAPFLFVSVVVALVGYGLITLYSASYDEALSHGLPTYYYFMRQTVFALFGFALFFVIRFIPMTWIKKAIGLFLFFSLVLMVITLTTSFGVSRLGARRWIQIGPLPSFQPSELLKVSVILFLSSLLSQSHEKSHNKYLAALLGIGVIAISALLIVLQRDYSTTLMFLLVALAMLVAGGVSIHYIGMFAFGLGVPAVVFLFLEPYRIRRVVSFLFPAIDPTGLNWQVQNALRAITSGGFFGKGLGNGTYKLGVIPEVQSDFIFASLAEELGLAGVFVFIILFTVFAVLGFSTAYRQGAQGNRFLAYVSFGVTFMIVWQAIVHVAVVTSLLPPTGIPLPFFSQGGTNLFMVLGECGLLYRCMITEKKGAV